MQRIRIKNFRVVKDADIDIQHVLVLIGEQASGKSTISKLIYFFESLRMDFLRSISMKQKQHYLFFISQIRQKFFHYFGQTLHEKQFTITYYYSQNSYITISPKAKVPPRKWHLKIVLSKKFSQTLFIEAYQLMMNITKASQKQDVTA